MLSIKILIFAASIFVAVLASAVPLDLSATQVGLDSQNAHYSDLSWRKNFTLAGVSELAAIDSYGFLGAVDYDGYTLPAAVSKVSLEAAAVKLSMQKRKSNLLADFSDANRNHLPGAQHFPADTISSFAQKKSHVSDPNSFFLLGIGILALAVARRRSTV